MADDGEKTGFYQKTVADLEKAEFDKFNKKLKDALDRERRMMRHYEWRGNKLPPFSIEPMPFVRQRLAGKGMTDAERALRKQWVEDQVLSANEPRNLPELNHLHNNPIGYQLAKPWNAFEKMLTGVVGKERAHGVRTVAPKLIAIALAVWAGWYNVKYHPASWEAKLGWHTYSTKVPVYPGDPSWPTGKIMKSDEFRDKGFTNRKVLRDL